MKKYLLGLLLFSIIIVSSCTDANDKLACYSNVQKEFPNAIKIAQPINKNYTWMVLDADSSVWLVETMSTVSPKVSGKQLMFNLKK